MRDVPVDVDPAHEAAPRARPLHACARSSASSSCARRCARLEDALADDDEAASRRRCRPRRRPSASAAARAASPTSRALGPAGSRDHDRGRRARVPEGQLLAEEPRGASARSWGEEALVGAVDDAERARRRARRPPGRSPTTPRRWARSRPNLAHDTLLAAYLLEPARRGFPFAEICEERGLKTDVDRAAGRRRGAGPGAGRLAARAARRARADGAAWTRSSCRSSRCCATWSSRACGSNQERLAEIRDARRRTRSPTLEREIWDLAGEEFTIGSPQQLGAILFDKLGLSKKRRGKTGFSTDARVLQAIRDEHPIIPKIERWRELNQLMKTYLDVLPQLADARVADPHDVRAGRRHHRPAGLDQPQPAERAGAHAAGPRDPRLLRGAPGNVLISADYSQVELRVMALHRRRAGAQGDLRPRRGRAHRHRVAGLRQAGRGARRRWTARSPR